eukprot:TRINITY_DN49417_c0_g1_i1.p2 TRINITY_DN49417_c0_g1~~TRINITY_DN49417_c0_g1_i1.p2  ORF type:complete len:146 (+),score=16.42 TRINITY_DN49417_c0_g1_i1:203-640(+)
MPSDPKASQPTHIPTKDPPQAPLQHRGKRPSCPAKLRSSPKRVSGVSHRRLRAKKESPAGPRVVREEEQMEKALQRIVAAPACNLMRTPREPTGHVQMPAADMVFQAAAYRKKERFSIQLGNQTIGAVQKMGRYLPSREMMRICN